MYHPNTFAGPDLTPYKPSGWSDKIVARTGTGCTSTTCSSSSSFTDSDTIYVNWAVVNSGTASTSATFTIQLYVDSTLKQSWTQNGLSNNTYTWVANYSIGSLSGGSHTLEIRMDTTDVVSESSETNNIYSKTITVSSTSKPDLTPYKPSGWSDKIVARTGTGCTLFTCSSSSSFTDSDTIYVNWAVINSGTASTSATFTIQLYVDGTLKQSWTQNGLSNNSYTGVVDYSIGSLSGGSHTLEIRMDTTDVVSESSESNNNYSFFISVSSTSKPDLTPYKPSGWSDKIVARTGTGCTSTTCSSSSSFTDSDTIYVNWAVVNSGTVSISATFTVQLYVDGTLKQGWTPNGLSSNFYTWVANYSIGSLSGGSHTLEIRADTTDVVSESSETNNIYSKTITVSSTSKPDLTPYKPSGWSDKIVARTGTGCTLTTCSSSSSFTDSDTIYVNWAVINSGTASTSATFTIQLYVDGTLKQGWTKNGLSNNSYTGVVDYSIGSLSGGSHTLEIRADTTDVVSESSESNNTYSKTISVSGGQPDIRIDPTSLTFE